MSLVVLHTAESNQVNGLSQKGRRVHHKVTPETLSLLTAVAASRSSKRSHLKWLRENNTRLEVDPYDILEPHEGKIRVHGKFEARRKAENRFVQNAERGIQPWWHGRGLVRLCRPALWRLLAPMHDGASSRSITPTHPGQVAVILVVHPRRVATFLTTRSNINVNIYSHRPNHRTSKGLHYQQTRGANPHQCFRFLSCAYAIHTSHFSDCHVI